MIAVAVWRYSVIDGCPHMWRVESLGECYADRVDAALADARKLAAEDAADRTIRG